MTDKEDKPLGFEGFDQKIEQVLAETHQPTRYLDKIDEAAPETECFHAFWAARGTRAAFEAMLFNIHKYNWRLGKKDDPTQELKKIQRYTEMALEVAEAAEKAGVSLND